MTQTPEDPQNLPEIPASVDLPTSDSSSAPVESESCPAAIQAPQVTDVVPAVTAPIPTPTYVYTPPVTSSEQSAGSASPAV